MSDFAARLTAIEGRLTEIEIRLGRAERLGYGNYMDVRSVARYAHENVLLEATPETVKKLRGMDQLQDQEALAVGMSAEELVVLKMSTRNVAERCRVDALEIAKIVAEMVCEAAREQLSQDSEEEVA